MDHSANKPYLIPKAADLEHFGNFTEMADGFLLSDLDETNQWIEVQAKDIILKIAIIDKKGGLVMVQSRDHEKLFIKPEVCCLSGSTLGGSFLKMRWIGIGFHLELLRLKEAPLSRGRKITTSTVQSIIVWNDPEEVKKLLQSV